MTGNLLHALWLAPLLSFLWAASSPSLVTPNVTNISANQEVTSPAPVSFSCTVDSYPPSNITWLHNGAEIQATPSRVTISTVQVDNRTQESNLTLLNTTAEDIGTYTCSAVNVEGSINVTTELQVLSECGTAIVIVCTADTAGEGRKTCNCAIMCGLQGEALLQFIRLFNKKMLECSSWVKVTKQFL